MIDADLVAKKLAMIETYVRELEELARPDALRTDVREERFVENRTGDLLKFVREIRQRTS